MNGYNPLDRYWRWMVALGVFLCCLALALLLGSLSLSLSQGIPANPLNLTFDEGQIAPLIWVCAFGCWLWRWGVNGQRRMRLRLRTIANELDAMPVANALPAWLNPASTKNSSDESGSSEIASTDVYLSWQNAHYKQRGELLRGCGSVFAGLAVGIAVMIVAIVLTTQLHLPPPWNTVLLIGAIIAPLLIGLATIVLLLLKRIPLPTLTPVIPTWELYADAEGITLRHGKHRQAMNWQDVRLFEIEQSQLSSTRSASSLRPNFTLWNGRNNAISWPTLSETAFLPALVASEGMTMSELVRRQGVLMGMIRDHTQLEPHTLSPALHRPERGGRPRNTASGWTLQKLLAAFAIVFFLLLVFIPINGALTILVVPLTRSPLANIYGALWLGTIGLGLLILLIVALINTGITRHHHTPPTLMLPPAPAGIGTNGAYILVEKSSWNDVVVRWLGLPVLLNGAVIIYSLIAPGHVYPLYTLGSFLIYLADLQLAILAFIGIVIVIFSLSRPTTTILQATSQGVSVSKGWRSNTANFAWDEIIAVEARYNRKRITGFSVTNAERKTISWRSSRVNAVPHSLDTDAASRANTTSGGSQVTPEELMALVLERTGLSMEMVADDIFGEQDSSL